MEKLFINTIQNCSFKCKTFVLFYLQIVQGVVVSTLVPESGIPFVMCLVDSEGCCLPCTVYNWAAGTQVKIGDAVAVLAPVFKEQVIALHASPDDSVLKKSSKKKKKTQVSRDNKTKLTHDRQIEDKFTSENNGGNNIANSECNKNDGKSVAGSENKITNNNNDLDHIMVSTDSSNNYPLVAAGSNNNNNNNNNNNGNSMSDITDKPSSTNDEPTEQQLNDANTVVNSRALLKSNENVVEPASKISRQDLKSSKAKSSDTEAKNSDIKTKKSSVPAKNKIKEWKGVGPSTRHMAGAMGKGSNESGEDAPRSGKASAATLKRRQLGLCTGTKDTNTSSDAAHRSNLPDTKPIRNKDSLDRSKNAPKVPTKSRNAEIEHSIRSIKNDKVKNSVIDLSNVKSKVNTNLPKCRSQSSKSVSSDKPKRDVKTSIVCDTTSASHATSTPASDDTKSSGGGGGGSGSDDVVLRSLRVVAPVMLVVNKRPITVEQVAASVIVSQNKPE